MIITITIASILILTVLVRLANSILQSSVCPVCAGSLLTWVGLIGAHLAGYTVNLAIPAVLMGGSVVGIAYQLEKKFWRPADAPLLFKTLFMPGGFLAAYAVLAEEWIGALVITAFLVIVAYAFIPKQSLPVGTTMNVKKKIEDCC